MKEYLHRDTARTLVAESPERFLGSADEVPVVDLFADAGVKAINERQIELYTSKYPILGHLGERALRVLDIGPWYESLGLYIASKGHDVTAIDLSDGVVAWQNNAARRMNLANFEAFQGNVFELDGVSKYDVVIAGMLLHFMDKEKAEVAIGKIQDVTVIDGLNAVSVYTNDNPTREQERGLVSMYSGVNELAEMYDSSQWEELERHEGPRAHAVDRGSLVGESMVLLPTIAEVIVKKIPIGAKLPDLSNIDDFNEFAAE